MKFFSRKNLDYLKNNLQLVYGVVLLILIPAALIINSLIFINNTQKVIDVELQRKASLATGVLSSNIPDLLDNQKALQARVEKVAQKNDEVHSLDILVPEEENFKIVASLDPKACNTISKYLYNTLAWRTEEAIAYQTTSQALSTEDQSQRSDERFWVVVKPVKDEAGEKVALVSMKISSKIIDQLTRDNLNRSIIVLVVTLVIIILLLLNNTRLFQYALLAKKLKEIDQMKDEFISMASHELRAPIVGIRGYLSMMADGSFGKLPVQAESKLQLVLEETERLHDLVEDLLDVARIEQGRIKLNPKALQISAVAESIVKSFAKQAEEKGLELNSKVNSDFPPVYADESKLKQVLVNLVSNAIKYTVKGEITLTAEVDKEMIKLKVSDTGIGMSAKERERLFEKFYRVQNQKTDKVSGTGLGLWITRELIRMMKGDIYVDSIENVGTHVTVLLSVYKEKK